ncbi:MAG TPA: hypothetical protein IGS53_25755 [Leptolyngbyaceae cyanobacterium M33_DOE_097]|uniref:Uncharacterized protein n=1 Tax=Oscillatoriales cyanobacterium SpSt-418 TaxID=2282169 RepID=A0A7C3KE06_9CYAN|nr:hypothetical protein [Leptolyngbyaceae cyanobacterium M33_DOE_097]
MLTQTESTVQLFLEGRLPKSEWTHAAHLRVGLWYVMQLSPGQSLIFLRDRIRQYNVACGVANTETQGYHETITRFYVWLIAQFLQQADRSPSLDELADQLIAYADQHSVFHYYSRARLMSVEARFGWVEPDLLAIAMPQDFFST